MAITAQDVLGRVLKKTDVLRTDAVREYGAAKILKFAHLGLHIVMPATVREWQTAVSDALAITGSAPSPGTKTGVVGSVSLSSITINSSAAELIELHSVTNEALTGPYKRVIGLEHFANLGISDESGATGRYWWPARGSSEIKIYRGSEISEANVVLGFTKQFDTSYAVLGADYSAITFDCPPEAVDFLIAQTAVKIFEDARAQIPDLLVQELQDQRALAQSADAAVAAQLEAMERRGSDSTK